MGATLEREAPPQVRDGLCQKLHTLFNGSTPRGGRGERERGGGERRESGGERRESGREGGRGGGRVGEREGEEREGGESRRDEDRELLTLTHITLQWSQI